MAALARAHRNIESLDTVERFSPQVLHRHGFDHLPTEDEVAQVSDRWRPYRSLAVSYLFAPEYGAHP